MMSIRMMYLSVVSLFLFCVYANQAWVLPGELEVKVLDIGQGDSILIRTPMGKNLLVDGGPGQAVLERLEEEMGYWGNSLDLVVLTHPDLDHLEGLIEVLKRYEVDKILMTGVSHGSAAYAELLNVIRDREVEVLLAYADEDYRLERDVFLDTIYPVDPVAGQVVQNINDTSITLKLVYGQTRYLLSGDCEVSCETAQLRTDVDLSADVITGGHHGSKTSFSLPYLLAVRPKMVGMSNGRNNTFGHPHRQTLDKLASLGIAYWNTSESGTIRFGSNGREWTRGGAL